MHVDARRISADLRFEAGQVWRRAAGKSRPVVQSESWLCPRASLRRRTHQTAREPAPDAHHASHSGLSVCPRAGRGRFQSGTQRIALQRSSHEPAFRYNPYQVQNLDYLVVFEAVKDSLSLPASMDSAAPDHFENPSEQSLGSHPRLDCNF